MNIYLYSNKPKLTTHWQSILDNSSVVNVDQLNKLNGILILDYDSYKQQTAFENLKVMVLDAQPTFEKCIALMQEGVKAYGNVYMHQVHLLSAIESINSNKVWMYPDFVTELITSSHKPSMEDKEEKLTSLTARELEITKLICDGFTNKEIASKLTISLSTVKNHTKHIYEKLNVNDRLSLFAYLKYNGLFNY